MSGIQAAAGRYSVGQRIEWLLSQDSVGHFVQVGGGRSHYWFSKSRSQKLSNSLAIGHTSNHSTIITRGTPSKTDDVWLPRGQSWVSVTAATEGVTHVTAYAPRAPVWQQRRQTATIHWVDAQWQLPAPAVVQAGQPHTLSTTVTRASDAAPLAGWLVRYEILGAATAGFSPSGESAIEIPIDADGRANVELTPPTQGASTRVQIQIIRPATPGGLPRTVVGQGWTSVTWSAPALAVRVEGPKTVDLDATATYRIEVSNPGNMVASAVKLTATVPPEMSFVGSNPPGQVFGERIEWSLGDLAARGVTTVEIRSRADRRGDVKWCAVASGGQGLQAEGCAETRVFSPSMKVTMSGPNAAQVGQQVQFKIEITNISDQPLTGIQLSDQFDAGLEHADGGKSPIQRPLEDLPAGQSHQIAVTFNVRQAGRFCHRLDVSADGGESATSSACVNVVTANQPAPPATEPKLQLRVFSPKQRQVGEIAEIIIDVTNTGSVPLTDVQIVDNYPTNQLPDHAWPGYRHEEGKMSWTVDRLEPGKSVRRQVNCNCLQAEAASTHRVTITTKEKATAEQQASTEILAAAQDPPPIPPRDPVPNIPIVPDQPKVPPVPVAGKLQITLADQNDPIKVGGETTYLIIVKNDRTASDKDVRLTITLPEGLQLKKLSGPVQHQTSEDFRTVAINPVVEMRPGETLAPFRLQVTAMQAGKFRLHVKAESLRSGTDPVEVTEDTTVLAE